MLSLEQGATFNAAAFVLAKNIVNENGNPINFNRHKFLLDFYMDQSPKINAIKCSQVGFSTTAILKSIHLSKYKKANIIYLLPSKSIVKDFVIPKFNPLVASNDAIKELMGSTDNLGLKSVGTGRDERFIYFRSSWDEASGIAISAHVLVADELDRSNLKAINTYKTRLDAALLDRPDLGYYWAFSNPTIEGAGVDLLYQQSDQKRWMIRCSRCNSWQELQWPESINFEQVCYICMSCQRPLSEDDRIRGRWIKTYLNRDSSGYRISQLMAPWIPLKKIIDDSLGDQSIFYNFTLGRAYTSKDIQITREAITKCLYPTTNPMTDVAIGVDNGIVKHYVIGNKYGIFRIGSTEDWQLIEQLRNQYNAYMVIDSNPYPTPVQKLCEKYPGKVFAHWYDEDSKDNVMIHYGEGDKRWTVHSDRTKLIDSIVADINAQDILFNFSLTELENNDFINHCLNEYRVVEESAKGIRRGVWKVIEGKPDHFLHALCYLKVAMQKTLSVGGVAHTPPPKSADSAFVAPTHVDARNQLVSGFDFQKVLKKLDNPRRR